MNANRIFFLIGGIAIVAILALGWFLGVSPLLATAGASDAERQTVEAENSAQEAILRQMKDQYAQLDVLNAELADLQLSVPAQAEVEDFIDLTLRIAHAAGVKVLSITISEGTLYGGGATPGTVPAATTESGVPVAPSSALVPTAGLAANLYAIPITIVVESAPAKAGVFLQKIQRSQRLMLVNSVAMSTGPPSSTISGYLFVVSSGVPVVPVTPTPAGVTPEPTDTPTPSPTDTATPAPAVEPTPTPTGTPAS